MSGFVMRGEAKRARTGQSEGIYSMGRQTLVVEQKDNWAPSISYHFDGVSTDRFVCYLTFPVSDIKCAGYRFFATHV